MRTFGGPGSRVSPVGLVGSRSAARRAPGPVCRPADLLPAFIHSPGPDGLGV